MILKKKKELISIPLFNHKVDRRYRYIYAGKDAVLITREMVNKIRKKILNDCIKNPGKYLETEKFK